MTGDLPIVILFEWLPKVVGLQTVGWAVLLSTWDSSHLLVAILFFSYVSIRMKRKKE